MRAEARSVIARRHRAGVFEAARRSSARSTCRRRARRSAADDAAGRQRLLPGDDREVHDARPDGAADPRDRPERSRAHQGARWRRRSSKPASRARWPSSSTFLRTDPQFYAKTPRELLSYSAYVLKKADWKLEETIGFLPRYRHGIRAGARRARADLHRRPRRARELPDEHVQPAGAPALHAAGAGAARVHAGSQLPGGARARRARAAGVPRGTSFSGYGEGWGLYTEWLGTVDGHLRDAVRGVRPADLRDVARVRGWSIDTGIHQLRLEPRAGARLPAATTRALSEHEITTEVDRYIAWPGQALAYKLGEMQIRRHRREAEEELGREVRPAQIPRRHPGARRGAAAGAGGAHGASSSPTAARIRRRPRSQAHRRRSARRPGANRASNMAQYWRLRDRRLRSPARIHSRPRFRIP